MDVSYDFSMQFWGEESESGVKKTLSQISCSPQGPWMSILGIFDIFKQITRHILIFSIVMDKGSIHITKQLLNTNIEVINSYLGPSIEHKTWKMPIFGQNLTFFFFLTFPVVMILYTSFHAFC